MKQRQPRRGDSPQEAKVHAPSRPASAGPAVPRPAAPRHAPRAIGPVSLFGDLPVLLAGGPASFVRN